MLTASRLSARFGDNLILDDVTFTLNAGERIGLVGPNGAGKTTLLRILAGDLRPDGGSVAIAPSALVGYLRQGFAELPEGTLADLLDVPTHGLLGASAALDRATDLLADPAHDPGPAADAYQAALDRLTALGGYEALDTLLTLLDRLGLPDADLRRPLSGMSGGEKTRAGIAGLLATRPDLLLLDEPTNHLDAEALAWLAEFVAGYQGAVLIVSHDRAFLDQVATAIYELDDVTHALTVYPGDFSDYVAIKQVAEAAQLDAWQRQQREIARIEADIAGIKGNAYHIEGETINFYYSKRAKKLARTAKVRERKLERLLESEERIDKPELRWGLALEFGEASAGARDVVHLEDVAVTLGDTPVLRGLDLDLRHGERVALTGPNGTGKSTLMRVISGEIAPERGIVRIGANVRIGYFAQEQELLDLDQTVLAQARARASGAEGEIRAYLHRFLFGGETVYRRAGDLSYGERARLMLALLVLEGANFLMLDEPLNHLDIQARERFEQALLNFDGTMLMVLHDRYAIERLATRVVELREGVLHETNPPRMKVAGR
jgi:ATP-binding cassette, subfamily F, member 3